MTEDQFRAALRNQVGEHIVRLVTTYELLRANVAVIANLARKDGVSAEFIRQAFDEENGRVDQALDAMAQQHAGTAPEQRVH